MEWMDHFDLGVQVSRRIVLSGNTLDLLLGEMPGSDSLRITLRDWLVHRLQSKFQYANILELRHDAAPERLCGRAWDALLEDVPSDRIPKMPTARGTDEPPNQDRLGVQLDMLGKVFDAGKTHVAAILMNAELLFTNPSVPADRQLARIRSVSDRIPPRGTQDGECPGSCLILVFTHPAAIPDQMFANDPEMRSVQITLPSPQERLRWLERASEAGVLQLDKEELSALAAAAHDEPLKSLWAVSVLKRADPGTRADELLRLYRVGNRDDPWEDGNLQQRLMELEDGMRAKIVGQEHAVDAVIRGLDRAAFGGGRGQSKPRGVLFFAGPTGVGKSLMAKLVAQALFRSDRHLTSFDMSEYRGEFGHSKLIGSGPGWEGYKEGGRLIEAVRSQPFQVLLFDEFEKASPDLYDLFLQILDEARCTDARGRTAYFGHAFIIFTSNIGGSLVSKIDESQVSGVPTDEADVETTLERHRKTYLAAVKHCFYNPTMPDGTEAINRPELYHRIGEENFIAFNPILTPEARLRVACAAVEMVKGEMEKEDSRCMLEIDPTTVASFVLDSVHVTGEGGGREVYRAVDRMMRDARVLLRKRGWGEKRQGGTMRIEPDLDSGRLEAFWK